MVRRLLTVGLMTVSAAAVMAAGAASDEQRPPAGDSRDPFSPSPISVCAQSVAGQEQGPYQYTFKSFEGLHDSSRARDVPTTVYYPTNDGPFPLVIVSHGASGDRSSLLSHAYELASHGYVVAVPEHVKSNRAYTDFLQSLGYSYWEAIIIMAADTTEWENRPKDVSFLINTSSVWNASDPDLVGKIDIGKIGCLGHSYGAYTCSAIMGALVNMPGGLTDFSDSRVDVGLAISPQGSGGQDVIGNVNDWFVPTSWDNITRPVIHHAGTAEDGGGWRMEPFSQMPPGDKYHLQFLNANHFDFADTDLYWNDPEGQLRNEETKRVSKALAVRGFDVYLKGHDRATFNEDYADSLCRLHTYMSDILWDEKLQAPVSGIAEFEPSEPKATGTATDSRTPNTTLFATAMLGGVLLLAAGAWYARRRWQR